MKQLLSILLLGWLVFSNLACSSSALPQSSIPAPTLTTAYPTDLAVASPYAASSASSSLNLIKQMNKSLLDDPGATYQEKISQFNSILEAKTIDGCSFSLNLNFNDDQASCYGPAIDYTGHPEAIAPADADGSLPPGDLGLWDELDESGNACAASQMNKLFGNVAGQVDSSLGVFASLLCVANNNDVSLPTTGETSDLTALLQDAFGNALGLAVTINDASISRVSDTPEGKPVYEMSISGTDGAGNQISFSLTHIPLDTDNETYKGKLSFAISNSAPGFSINCGEVTGATSGASILYEKTSTTNLAYQLNRADFCGVGVNPFDTNNNIDPADKYEPADNTSGWAKNYNRAVINLNPETGESTVSYAWQAGSQDDNTRVFLANVEQIDSSLAGCSYYGFGPDIADDTSNQIDGFICNWAGPGSGPFGNKTIAEKVQRQCVTQNEAGLFESDSDTLNIAYAPTNSCDTDSESFIFDGIQGPFTNELLGLELLDFTDPEIPADL